MTRPASEIKPAYLIAGTDRAKIDAALARLRARAEREGGAGALETFGAAPGQPPNPEPLLAAIPAMSLTAERRYLVVEGVERWQSKQANPVIGALGDLPPDLTVVLVAHEDPPRLRAPKPLASAVKEAGGEVVSYAAPATRELPAWLVREAARRDFRLDPAAARLLAERMGGETLRLTNELDRLALWAGPGGTIAADDLAAMVADTSEEAAWSLSDAMVAQQPGAALAAAERLTAQGETLTPLLYQAAKRLREALRAVTQIERGRSAKEVEASLDMHPYAAKMLVRRVSGTSVAELRAATCAVADLEWWSRGGADYPEDVALTLAVRRAAGS
jgi:DNA polymerase III delta subunit